MDCYMRQIHHFVCPPFAPITAWHRSFILSMYSLTSSNLSAVHSLSMYLRNSAKVRGDLLLTLCFSTRHTFSIGFRSGELAGQLILSMSLLS